VIIGKRPQRVLTKQDLLWDEKYRDEFEIGNSINAVRMGRPMVKFGLYISEFDEVTPADCVFLQLCKSNCSNFIVGIPTEHSLRLNGKTPRFSTSERIFRLASLYCVDWIISFDEQSCALAVDKVSPDFIFYGRTTNDKSAYDLLIDKSKLTLVDYPWREERAEGKFFKL
jgi:bifunctional ADP-heptose synthase (sugar kinase/adenylyltransferase)